MNKLDLQYQALLKDIIYNGREKGDRTGTGTISIFGRQIRHKMSDGYPLLTTKKMAFKTMVTELLWFLKGDTNIKYLVDNGCNIWNGDAYKKYISKTNEYKGNWPDTIEEFIERIKADDEFAEKWGELGPIYGKQWREWKTDSLIKTTLKDPLSGEDTYVGGVKYIDQIANLINDLKTNPDSRRLMVNAWNVGELDQMTLPPCHYGFQVYTRELLPNERKIEWAKSIGKDPSYAYNLSQEDLDDRGFPRRTISLMWNQRSVDTFLGLPFNIASYGLLLLILAKEVNMLPDELIGNLGDVHLYKNHIDQALEQMERKSFELPRILFKDHLEDFDSIIDILRVKDFVLDGYESHPSIKAPLNN
jgi:thymidylate synthase